MSSKKTIAVIGATGLQGGSVAKFLLEDGTFSVRAITRNPDSPAAKALTRNGAHVVQADSGNIESLIAAFSGVYGVFGVTNFSEPGVGHEGERAQGIAMVDAAKKTGVKHFVWSTLDRTEYKPVHWESKADVDDYLRESGVPRTSLYTSFFYENFTSFLRLNKNQDGSFDFPLQITPDIPIACFYAGETGAWTLAALKNPDEWIGKDMRIAAELISTRNIAKTISELSGKRVNIKEITTDLSPPDPNDKEAHRDLQTSFKLVLRYNKPPFRDPDLTHRLYPETTLFRAWAKDHIDAILA